MCVLTLFSKLFVATTKVNYISYFVLSHFCFAPAGESMVLVPGGDMKIGTNAADGRDGESPARAVKVETFQIDKYPVTNSDFR